MVFSSVDFLLLFLPLTLLGYVLAVRLGGGAAGRLALLLASFVFYAWWRPDHLYLLIGSILVNYTLGVQLLAWKQPARRRLLLCAAVTTNLLLLGYFKYASFLVGNVSDLLDLEVSLPAVALPLGISFFTFQQISFIVDCYHRRTDQLDLVSYALCVTFFPHLVAGPLMLFRDLQPQFRTNRIMGIRLDNLAAGLTIFAIGLFKKRVIADGIAIYPDRIFGAADTGLGVGFFEAWGGAVAYSIQLYFDFSGYSDMAIGLARMFGVRLPMNFFSPYQATSIIEFWRRWHITLSRFLRDHVYFPLGGSRGGRWRHFRNLWVTMLLAGIWHGAGWTFVIWGAYHATLLLINHAWRQLAGTHGRADQASLAGLWSRRIGTFLLVTLGWVVFRAGSLDGALVMLRAMSGVDGVQLPAMFAAALQPVTIALGLDGVTFGGAAYFSDAAWFMCLGRIAVSLAICWFMPNAIQVTALARPVLAAGIGPIRTWRWALWRPNLAWGAVTGVLIALALVYETGSQKFLYFDF